MYRVCSFAAGQLIADAQAQAYTREHLLPHSVRFTRPTVRVWITVCRSTLSQHNRRKDGFHFNKRNCFSLELKAEIINAIDMKRKTKAQIYKDYKYNIKIFAWNTLYLLERQRSHETQSKGPWVQFILLTNTVVTSAIKIVISIQVSQPQCHMSAPLYDVSRCIHWHFDAGSPAFSDVVLFDWLPSFNEVGSRLV